jgi:hypothetical protein
VKTTKIQQIADEIAQSDRVIKTQVTGSRIRVVVDRMYGGPFYLTLPEAKKMLARESGK